MLKIREIKAKSIITKSGLDVDYVINPYVGCMHGCLYCYARFMKRFTDHHEPWGKFVDIKINAPELIPQNPKKYKDKSIFISSVTDSYQPLERRYQLTRKILEKLIPLEPDLSILTKSDLIIRDIDLLKQFKKCKAGFSLSTLDEKIQKEIEPLACSPQRRIKAVKELKSSGIKNFIFISPILPEITNWKKIIKKTTHSTGSGRESFVDEFWFENLNMRATNWDNLRKWLKNSHPELLNLYQDIRLHKIDYWSKIEKEIKDYCKKYNLSFSIYFHH